MQTRIDSALVLDGLPLAVVVVDRAGRIAEWNHAAESLYGHDAASACGAPALELLFDPDDRAEAEALIATDGEWEGDFRVRRRDGALLVSSFRLTRCGDQGWAWIATDHVDQGLAEAERSALLQAERAARSTAEAALGLVEAILTSAPIGIAVLDLELRYVRVNDAFASLSGLPAENHIGGRLGDVVPVQADMAADFRRVLTTGRVILGRHVELHDAGGRSLDRHFSVSYFPVHTATGAMMGVGLAGVEITEAKRAEAARLAVLRRAEAAQERLSILATASSVLTTTMELDELLSRLTKVLSPAVSDWSIIELIDGDDRVEHVAVSHRERSSASDLASVLLGSAIDRSAGNSVAYALRAAQSRLASGGELNALIDDAAALAGRPELHGAFCFGPSLVVPIEARDRVHGVLILANENSREFDDDDLDLAVEVAHRAALAVSNARAYQQEHHIAESLQRALLPATLPPTRRLDVAVRYVAATDGALVGGDWYDVLAFDDGATGLVIGDVVGHDIAASASMGQLRSVLRAFALEDHAVPAETLGRVDRVFDRLGVTCATCLFGLIDDAAETFTWGNTGHPPPLLLRNGEARFLDDVTGVMLGVVGGTMTEGATTDLRVGDVLVLYTDGLIERRGESLETGLERLAAAARDVVTEDAEVVCNALVECLVPSRVRRDDDVAILVARVRSPHDNAAPKEHRLPFDSVPESIALARGFTAGVLQSGGWSDAVDTATLLVSELATNAVKHGEPPCAVTITVRPEFVEVSVEDSAAAPPAAREPEAYDESGRGLLLLRALAQDWGVRRMSDRKSIWFRLTRD